MMMTAIAPSLGTAAQAGAQRTTSASWLLGILTCTAMALVLASSAPLPVAVLLLFAPFAEESAFRAGLQEWMLRNGIRRWSANLITALVFCALHCMTRGASLQSIAVFFPALFIGWVYGRGRDLKACIALHIFMNLLWFALIQLTPPIVRTL